MGVYKTSQIYKIPFNKTTNKHILTFLFVYICKYYIVMEKDPIGFSLRTYSHHRNFKLTEYKNLSLQICLCFAKSFLVIAAVVFVDAVDESLETRVVNDHILC